MASGGLKKELRIVLIGTTGVGKSSLGNSLIKKPRWFPSPHGLESVTKQCRRGMTHLNDDTLMIIIDTPGLFSTSIPNNETITEIGKCVVLASPGPHIFILVFDLSNFRKHELETINYLKDVFGERFMDYVIVVFTGKDKLDDDGDTMTIEEYVNTSPEDLRDLVNLECKGRYTAICNRFKSSTHETDVQSIINLIRSRLHENDGGYYVRNIHTEISQEKSRLKDHDIQDSVKLQELEREYDLLKQQVLQKERELQKQRELGLLQEHKIKQRKLQKENELNMLCEQVMMKEQELQKQDKLLKQQELNMQKEQLKRQQEAEKQQELQKQHDLLKQQELQSQLEVKMLKEELSKKQELNQQQELLRQQEIHMLREQLIMKEMELRNQRDLQTQLHTQELQKQLELQKQHKIDMLKENNSKQQVLQIHHHWCTIS